MWLVMRFELAEALRSRLVAFVLLLYGAGAAVGTFAFTQAWLAAERFAAAALAESLGIPESEVPQDLVRRRALPELISGFVDDPALRDSLLAMDPLAIFYGFVALNVVAGLVLVTSSTAHAQDLATGAARFVLTRCDRWSWALGKTLGHAALLAAGLLGGALVAFCVASLIRGAASGATLLDLARTSLWAWLYGAAYLGIFSGISLLARKPGSARGIGLLTLFALWLGHTWCEARAGGDGGAIFAALAWLFPAQYAPLLWSPGASGFALAALVLLAQGALALLLAHAVFARRDA